MESSTPQSDTPASAARGRVIVVNDSTPTRPAKRARKSASETPRRTSARLAAATTPRSAQRSSRGGRARAAAAREDGDDDDDDDDDDDGGDDLLASIKKTAGPGSSFVHRSSFDAYFAAAATPSRTSNNVFSQRVPPLARAELARLLAAAPPRHAAELAQVRAAHAALFPRYALELAEGFNLLFFGFGSKRALLNAFARAVCAPRGHVVLVDAFHPRVGVRDVLARIEEVPGLAALPLPPHAAAAARARRIYDFFLPPAVRAGAPAAARPLFLVVHNIDAPALRAPRARAALALLALSPRIHVVASVDHVHAQTLWSTAEAGARKHAYAAGAGAGVPPARGFAWAWHDLTTMAPYDAELAHVDVARVPGRPGRAAAAAHAVTETAAQHVLASVNDKARKLFALLARAQLAGAGHVPYGALFHAARADFVATNDTTFKALLAEFRDHKLVVSSVERGGEMLGIPLRKEALRRLLERLAAEA